MLAKATALSLRDSLEFPSGAISPDGVREISQDTKTHIIELANTLQDILGEAMDTASAMFPHKKTPPPSRGALPRHLWPNSVRHDITEIRRRAKAIRKLLRLEANSARTTHTDQTPIDANPALWNCVHKPVLLRTTLSPLPRSLNTLGLLRMEDLDSTESNTTALAVQTCFKGLRQTIRALIKHARNVRRAKYGKHLLKLFVKKPNKALKSLLRTAAGSTKTNTLPTDLSIIKDEVTGLLITDPTSVKMKIVELETTALSPDPTLPPGAPFPWHGNVQAAPTSSVPMIAGQITPAIMQEALRRTPNHKAAGPDGVPGLVLKHMPPEFQETLHLLFQALAETGITPPTWLQSHTILLYKKETRPY